MLLWYSLISPSKGFFLIDDAKPFNPVKLANLPYDAQNKSCFAINNIYSSDSNDLSFKLIFANINNVIAVLDNVYPAVGFIGVLFPVDNVWPEFIYYFKQNSTCPQIIN